MMPLHRAVASEHEQMVEMLIEYGANANASNKKGETPLMVAAAHGNEKVAIITL